MPERCETCHWFKDESHMIDCKAYDGICKRFPQWVNVDCHHHCGEWKEYVKNKGKISD